MIIPSFSPVKKMGIVNNRILGHMISDDCNHTVT